MLDCSFGHLLRLEAGRLTPLATDLNLTLELHTLMNVFSSQHPPAKDTGSFLVGGFAWINRIWVSSG